MDEETGKMDLNCEQVRPIIVVVDTDPTTLDRIHDMLVYGLNLESSQIRLAGR